MAASRPTPRRSPDASRRARETQRRLIRSSRVARRQLVTTVLVGLVTTVLIIAQATLLAKVIAGVFIDGKSLAEVTPWLFMLAAVSVGRGLAAAGFESTGRFGAAAVMSELRTRLARHLLIRRPGALQGEHSGELVSAAVAGVESLENYFARYLPQVALAAIVPVAVLAWVVPIEWKSALIMAVTAPLIIVFMILIGRLTESRTRKRWGLMQRLSSHFLDLAGGLETLRANNRATAQGEAIARVGDEYRRETMGALRIGFLSALVLELLAMIGVAMVATAIGIQLAGGHLGLEAGLTVLILAPELYLPLREVGNQFHASTDGMVAAERIFEVLDLPPAVTVPETTVPAPDPSAGPLSLAGIRFSHPGRGEVLAGLDLTVESGETVALVGPSGGGKSTLISLLMRFADPEAGRIECAGVDLRQVEPDEWRRRVVWVPQRPTVFSGTVADNVRLYAPDAGQADLERAVASADLDRVLPELPDGLQTRVGEGGRRLSAGQSQRVALSRAFLSPAPLVILDEPTAHLDDDTEQRVATAIDRLVEGRSALVVSHRGRPLVSADRVLHLADGRLRPTGATA
ncbi:MAG: thiol reductant ABC exporter subunit CydD [Solirubrobacterales bacterium]|nr:thiol reductant ABC exporter subunit CydD [Solirubrobacterales bacterium]